MPIAILMLACVATVSVGFGGEERLEGISAWKMGRGPNFTRSIFRADSLLLHPTETLATQAILMLAVGM